MQVSSFIIWYESLYSSQHNKATTHASRPTSARGCRVNARYQLRYRATTRCKLTKHLQMLDSLCRSYATATPRPPGINIYSLLQHSGGSFQVAPMKQAQPTFSSPSIPASYLRPSYFTAVQLPACSAQGPCPVQTARKWFAYFRTKAVLTQITRRGAGCNNFELSDKT